MNEFITLENAFNTIADFPVLMQRTVQDILYKSYNSTPVIYPEIIVTKTSDGTYERYAGTYGDLSLAPMHKLEEYHDSSMKEGWIDIFNYKYGRSFSFAIEDIEDDNKGLFKDIPEKYGKEFRMSIEKAILDTLTDTSVYTAARGNKVTTNPTFSYDGVVEAYDLFTNQITPEGNYMNVFPDTLVLHPTQMWKVPEVFAEKRISHSGTTPTTGSFTIENPLATKRFNILYTPYLPSKTAWYLFKAKSSLIYQKRIGLEVTASTKTSQAMLDRDAYVVKCRTRFGSKITDYRFFVSNTGS